MKKLEVVCLQMEATELAELAEVMEVPIGGHREHKI
jgi:hypothetical protein